MAQREPSAWRDLRLGIFFLITTGLLVSTLFVVGTNSKLFVRKYELKVYLPNAQQLDKGSMVALAGLEIGKIKSIELAPRANGDVVEITLALPRSRQAQITPSSLAQIRTIGVLGDRFIDISIGDPQESPLPSGATLTIAAPTDWPATLARATGALDDFLALIREGAELLRQTNEGEGLVATLLKDPELSENLKSSSRDLAAVTRSLRAGEGSLGRWMKDPSTARRLESLLARVDSLAERAGSGPGLLPRMLNDEAMGDRLESAISGTDSLVMALRGDGTTGRLARDDELYTEMLKSAEELRALVADIKAHPDRYLKISLF